MFEKILIANRGEIAVRVIKTAKSLGYKTVAVYSDADKNASHVNLADEAVLIGAAPVGESYLCASKIIAAAKLTDAGAIHPGYGFLSENSGFANECELEGIEFIGPPSAAIDLMGSKRLSKIAMLAAGVPCIPGYEGQEQTVDALVREAKKIGFPIMVKASAGGGGRGMRLVHESSELEAQIKTARSEAENAFGDGELILEKAVIDARHIEIQVFADKHGNVVYLGERDCSIQRRHQKVVEEAPSPFVDETLRKAMGLSAVQAAKSCHYVGAGTVEFLVDAQKNFYFLEMNTRLQVEHPVTELVTGTDLVAWQLNVAAGHVLPLTQNEIQLNGHAMEVRLYAEDPANNFMPQTGTIHRWVQAENDGIRIDSGISPSLTENNTNAKHSAQVVSPFYDPMLAKIIAYGANREEARRRLIRAVEESTLFGVTVNNNFLCEVLRAPSFVKGEATTGFIGNEFSENPSLSPRKPSKLSCALSALVSYLKLGAKHEQNQEHVHALSGWSNTAISHWPYHLKSGEYTWQLSLEHKKDHYVIRDDEANDETGLELIFINADTICYRHQSIRQSCIYHIADGKIFLRLGSEYFSFEDYTHSKNITEDKIGTGQITASMDGAIIDVLAVEGGHVEKGQTLVMLEAMKMEHPLKADVTGIVESVTIKTGDQVKLRQLLVTIKAETPETTE
ncbi:MAG: geranyl-CoA carboxylase alpha subunit [Pseudohongiellaceae bacterium]|jgi:geranyl-CoA carboxylase alpha subunit